MLTSSIFRRVEDELNNSTRSIISRAILAGKPSEHCRILLNTRFIQHTAGSSLKLKADRGGNHDEFSVTVESIGEIIKSGDVGISSDLSDSCKRRK